MGLTTVQRYCTACDCYSKKSGEINLITNCRSQRSASRTVIFYFHLANVKQHVYFNMTNTLFVTYRTMFLR